LLEVFTRGNIAELVDHGTEYANRAIELSKTLKMDLSLVQGVQGRAITLGDIVSHNVSVTSFGQMLSYFETILDKKPLRPLLETAVDRVATQIHKTPSKPIIIDFDVLARILTRLFEVRHILCHETPRKPVYAVAEVEEFLKEAIRFTKALGEVLTFEKFGLVPLKMGDMDTAAREQLRKKEDELSRLLAEIRAIVKGTDDRHSSSTTVATDGTWLQSLNEAQEKWLSFRNAQCEFDTYLNRGGSMRPLVWASEAVRLTEIRIAELRDWLSSESERRR
jgi:uncharacterized protein YecT (DUF1311 family)